MPGTDSVHFGQHRLRRAAAAMTVDVVEHQRARDREQRELSAGDMVQQLQINVAGMCWREPVWTEFDVVWPYPFLMRVMDPSQRDSDLDNPHFMPGVEVLTDEHVIIDVQVRSWRHSESDQVIGAKVRACAWAPTARKKRQFAAILHLTFTGYAAPSEEDADDDEDEE